MPFKAQRSELASSDWLALRTVLVKELEPWHWLNWECTNIKNKLVQYEYMNFSPQH